MSLIMNWLLCNNKRYYIFMFHVVECFFNVHVVRVREGVFEKNQCLISSELFACAARGAEKKIRNEGGFSAIIISV